MKQIWDALRLRIAVFIMPKTYRIALVQTQSVLKQAGVTITALIGHIKRLSEDKENDGPFIH